MPRPAPCSGPHAAVSPRRHEALSKPSSSLEDERPARRCLVLARRLGGGDRGRRDRVPRSVGISRAGKAGQREAPRHSHERHGRHGAKALHAGEWRATRSTRLLIYITNNSVSILLFSSKREAFDHYSPLPWCVFKSQLYSSITISKKQTKQRQKSGTFYTHLSISFKKCF